MIDIRIDQKILDACPETRIGLINATVVNEPTCDDLWAEIEAAAEEIRQRYELLEINQRPAIAGTRHLYRSLGKDPSRYRVSSEALCRRLIRGLGIYRLTTLIDVVNLVSIKSGYAISGLDGDRIAGDAIVGSQTVTLDGLAPGTTYYVRAYAVTDNGLAYGDEVNFTTEGGGDTHDYVDLGLPSGLLWATCNVGATNPEDYGDYFAWGETTTKDTYNWSTYQYCMGSNTTLTKYCSNSSYGYNSFTDNLTTLLPEDDAATANWGNGWRMPTKEEWEELLINTTVIWMTQNGVNGRLFTASNGNSLFLPAAGCRSNSSLDYAGSRGYYWSSSLVAYEPRRAWYFSLGSGDYLMGNSSRYVGQSVRPVRSSQN